MSLINYDYPHSEVSKWLEKDAIKEYTPALVYAKDSIVLDVGAHIGVFSLLALNSGAKKVIAIEPSSTNVVMLKRNVSSNCEILHGAITGGNEEILTFRYLSHLKSMSKGKIVFSKNRTSWNKIPFTFEEVKAYRLCDILNKYRPRLIKLDCEGSEFGCLDSISEMPTHVEAFIAEWHIWGKNFEKYLQCLDKLYSWGFKPDKISKATPKTRYVRPILWTRKQA